MKPKVNRPLLLCAILMTLIAVLSLWSPTKGDMIETNEMQVESPLGIDNYQPGMSLMAISGQKSWGSFAGELGVELLGYTPIVHVNRFREAVYFGVGKAAQLGSGDVMGLCWTVVDAVATFVPGAQPAKIFWSVTKLLPSL